MVKTSVTPNTVWKVAEPPPASFTAQFPELPAPIRTLLYHRGLRDDASIHEFLNPDYSRLHDPAELTDMAPAVQTVLAAIKAKEQIVVHGDYDADGLTATAVLYDVIRRLGGRAEAFVPSRYVEGYGVSEATLLRLHEEGAGLVVTVDCGISSAAAITAARKRGLKVVVTDHHQPPPKLPVAEAVINPHRPGDKYPNKELAGVGVAFKLAQGLLAGSALDDRAKEAAEKWVLDLVALGTVADLMPLTGENRILVKYGLLVMAKSRRAGIRALMRSAGITPEKCTSTTIGYTLAPRLNAAGRLTHARQALDLLLTDDPREAERAAAALSELNAKRQAVTAKVVAEAKAQLGDITDEDRIIVLDGEWLSGIVGLVAGRLTQEYHRPALIIERGKDLARGSGRSTKAFDLVEALTEHRAFLKTYGGHARAAGFSLDPGRIGEFRTALKKFAHGRLAAADLRRVVAIDAELSPTDVSFELADGLEEFEPFGLGNPKPQFKLGGVVVRSAQTVGQDGRHLKLALDVPGGPTLPAVAFGFGDRVDTLKAGQTIDITGRPETNTFRNNKTLEWNVSDFRAR